VTRSLITVCLCLVFLAACKEELSVEQQIILTINEMETLAEAGERKKFMSHIAGEFNGQLGRMSKAEFNRFMIMQWNENQKLHAQLGPISVRETGPGTASAEFGGLITGGRGLLPERGQMLQFETSWILDDGEWLMETATWDPILMD
jgi:hypothetical protein